MLLEQEEELACDVGEEELYVGAARRQGRG